MPYDPQILTEPRRGADGPAEVVSEWREFHVRRTDPETMRLDRYLAARIPEATRTQLQRWIRNGAVTVNGRQGKASLEVRRDDVVRLAVPRSPDPMPMPEPIPLDVVYEDEEFLAIHKPAGMVVHPARGHHGGTLVNALLYHCRGFLSQLNGTHRPGIVHRLDRDTSGVILAAKTDRAHRELAKQFEYRKIRKEYRAIVRGAPKTAADEIHLPLARDLKEPTRMAVRFDVGKRSITAYETVESFDGFTWMAVRPQTGRTHQIRVHLATLRLPIVCDAVYGGGDAFYESDLAGRTRPPDEVPLLDRQALHAHRLRFEHPVTREEMEVVAPVPDDIGRTLDALRRHRPKG